MKFQNIYYKAIILFVFLITMFILSPQFVSVSILILFIYLYFFYKAAKTGKKIYFFLILAFTIRVIFIILDNFYGLVPYHWDTVQFHSNALLIKENILAFRPFFYNVNASISVKSYSFFVSIIYLIFGSYEITIRIINAFIGVYIAKNAYQIALIAKLNINSAHWVLNLVAFWPTFILYSSINMRDPLIIFLTLDIIKRFFLIKKKSFKMAFVFIINFIFIYYLRRQMVFLLTLIILFYFFIKKISKSKKIFKVIAIFLSICFFIGLIYVVQEDIFPFMNFNYIASEMEYRTSGGAAYLESLSYNSVFDIIKYIPIRSIYFLFGPFLWDLSVKNIFMLFAFIESFIFLILFLLGIKGFFDKKNLYNERLLFLLTFLFIGVAGYASITANYGTAIRHKMTFMIIIFIFISKSFSRYKLKIFK